MSATIQTYELPFEFDTELAKLVNAPIGGCDQGDVEGFFFHNVLGLDDVEATTKGSVITGVILRQMNTFDPTPGITDRFRAAMAQLQEFLFGTTVLTGMM